MPTPSLHLLDLALLQTLVAVNDGGSLVRAAEQVGRTQSAVSLQMQRLEQSLGLDLFNRSGRALVLTDAGQAMLGHARQMLAMNREVVAAVRGHRVAGRVRFGMSVDFEHTWLPRAMARFAQSHPKIEVALSVDRNSALELAVAQSDIDIALVFGKPKAAATPQIGTVPMRWIASRDFVWRRGGTTPDAHGAARRNASPSPGPGPGLVTSANASPALPLLLLDQACMFRGAAVQALDAAGLPWRVAVTSLSLGGLWATALAGMGVTARSGVVLPAGLVDVGDSLGLPPLPKVAVCLIESKAKTTAPRATLRRVLRELVEEFVDQP
jgi:DNA-binding transcriptional LysR family regulator